MADEMLLFASAALFFSAIAFTAGVICIINFKRGLKPILLGQVQSKPLAVEGDNVYYFQQLSPSIHSQEQGGRRFALD